MYTRTILIIFFMTLHGCAGFMAYKDGRVVTTEFELSLIKGETTQREVKLVLGYPDKIIQKSGCVRYIYSYSEINHIAPNRHEMVTFYFSKEGVYQSLFRKYTLVSNSPLIDW